LPTIFLIIYSSSTKTVYLVSIVTYIGFLIFDALQVTPTFDTFDFLSQLITRIYVLNHVLLDGFLLLLGYCRLFLMLNNPADTASRFPLCLRLPDFFNLPI